MKAYLVCVKSHQMTPVCPEGQGEGVGPQLTVFSALTVSLKINHKPAQQQFKGQTTTVNQILNRDQTRSYKWTQQLEFKAVKYITSNIKSL